MFFNFKISPQLPAGNHRSGWGSALESRPLDLTQAVGSQYKNIEKNRIHLALPNFYVKIKRPI
jgi:hypothetical protein